MDDLIMGIDCMRVGDKILSILVLWVINVKLDDEIVVLSVRKKFEIFININFVVKKPKMFLWKSDNWNWWTEHLDEKSVFVACERIHISDNLEENHKRR
jgi:hypothetical protein